MHTSSVCLVNLSIKAMLSIDWTYPQPSRPTRDSENEGTLTWAERGWTESSVEDPPIRTAECLRSNRFASQRHCSQSNTGKQHGRLTYKLVLVSKWLTLNPTGTETETSDGTGNAASTSSTAVVLDDSEGTKIWVLKVKCVKRCEAVTGGRAVLQVSSIVVSRVSAKVMNNLITLV